MPEIVLQKGSDNRLYKVLHGTWYDAATSDDLVWLMKMLERNGNRYTFYEGDPFTGRCHDNEQCFNIGWHNTGYVGRTAGNIKSPIKVFNSRSTGGDIISAHYLVRIERTKGKQIVWTHPNFHWSPATPLPTDAVLGGNNVGPGLYDVVLGGNQ